jgi:hypothetical protein
VTATGNDWLPETELINSNPTSNLQERRRTLRRYNLNNESDTDSGFEGEFQVTVRRTRNQNRFPVRERPTTRSEARKRRLDGEEIEFLELQPPTRQRRTETPAVNESVEQIIIDPPIAQTTPIIDLPQSPLLVNVPPTPPTFDTPQIQTMAHNEQGEVNGFTARVEKPYYAINWECLLDIQKTGIKSMLNLETNSDGIAAQAALDHLYGLYHTDQNPSVTLTRIGGDEAIVALTAVVYGLNRWTTEEWMTGAKREAAKSILEASVEMIYNVWHLMPTAGDDFRQDFLLKAKKIDVLFRRLLNLEMKNFVPTPLVGLLITEPEPMDQGNNIPIFNPQMPPPNFPTANNDFLSGSSGYNYRHPSGYEYPPNMQAPPRTFTAFTQNQVPPNQSYTQAPPSTHTAFTQNQVPPNQPYMQAPPSTHTAFTQNQVPPNQHNMQAPPRTFNQNAPPSYGNSSFPRFDQSNESPHDQSYTNAPPSNGQGNNFQFFSNADTAGTRNQNRAANSNSYMPSGAGEYRTFSTERRKFDDTALKITNTIKSWPNKFDGIRGNISQFVRTWFTRVNDEITEEMVLANVEYLLEGDALQWHKVFGHVYQNWYDYTKAMNTYFSKGKSEHELKADFEDSRHHMREKEDFMSYLTRLQTMANKLLQPPSAEAFFERVKRGLTHEYFTCKLSSRDIEDLMSKCVEFENSRKPSKTVSADPFGWIKERTVLRPFKQQNSATTASKPASTSWNDKDKFKNQNFQRKPPTDFGNKFNRFGNNPNFRRTTSDTRGSNSKDPKSLNEIELEKDEEVLELTRGKVRQITDADREHIQSVVEKRDSLASALDMDEAQYAAYMGASTCENCRERGHTVEYCEFAINGMWFEHCTECHAPNESTDSCSNCSKN